MFIWVGGRGESEILVREGEQGTEVVPLHPRVQ